MLNADPAAWATARGCVRIEVESPVVRFALLHVAAEEGWAQCLHDEPCSCLLVTDRARADGVDVLVVRDDPASCQAAVQAVMHGQARAVLLWNDPAALAAAFHAASYRSVLVPERVVELATVAPALNPRQRDTLRLVAQGRSNQAVATAMHQSLSTVKRTLSELLAVFDVPNRAALLSAATGLGFVPARCSWVAPELGEEQPAERG